MKKIQGLLLAATLMLTAGSLMGQSYSETALLFSRTRPTGTARVLGMGGANISLGGDMSSAYSNPAGLGMYNRSEFSISPGYLTLKNSGSYSAGGSTFSNNNSDTQSILNVPQLGIVFSQPQDGEGGFIHGSFAVTMTKINDFNSNLRYRGTNNRNSLTDYFINQANGYPSSQFSSDGDMYNTVTELAYDNYLIGEASIIDPSNPNDQYFTDFDPSINPNVDQQEQIQTKGAQNQWNIAYGANFNDKFFLGASVGIVALNFQSHKVFSETFTDQPILNYSLTEDLSIKGTGINLTVGGIFRPMDGLQLGASIATPTRYALTDNYGAQLSSHWDNFDYYGDQSQFLNNESAQTDIVTSSYNLTTPWKFSAGASYIFGKSGLISLDIEQLNYGASKYNSQTSGVSYKSDNDEIKTTYASTTNIRVGGEYRIKAFRIRAGFNYMTDPYKQIQNDINNSRMAASVGAGYKTGKFSFDVAYVNSWSKNGYRPYTLPTDSPLLSYTASSTNIVATLGFTF
jgi:hypothetical protein